MKLIYVHHSSFLLETEKLLMLFDYTEGSLPELAPDKKLLVFASHWHGDHFSPAIFPLAARHGNIQWILSDDITKNQVPEDCLDRTCFIAPHQKLEFPELDVVIHTYKSTDEGVAFLIRHQGQTIYHAGDLHDWRWPGEDKAWNNNMTTNYLRELDRIHADGFLPDVAMVVLDGRLEDWFYFGMAEFMERVGANQVFPMHFWGDFSIIRRFKQLPCADGFRDRIADIQRDGQCFELEKEAYR